MATSIDTNANSKLSFLQDAVDSALKIWKYSSNKDNFFARQLPMNMKLHDVLFLMHKMCTNLDRLPQLQSAKFANALNVADCT